MHKACFLILLLSAIGSTSWAEPLDLRELDELYAEAILSDAGFEGLIDRLESQAKDSARSVESRANAHLAAARVSWRHGLRDSALASAEAALALVPSAHASLMKARLLDAAGDQAQAVGFYEQVEATSQDEELRAFVRLRLTMIETDERSVEALRELALTRDQAFQNRAAITLAVLGHPEVAIELFSPDENAPKPFVEHARLADWAIEAEDFDLAQAEAWIAYEKAEFLNDRRYALAVVVETYRAADELHLMLEELAANESLSEDLLRLRIDTLIETDRLDEAIELYGSLAGDQADVEARKRLIGLYAAAGRTEEMLEEYRRLMVSEPDAVHWYNGLAAHYMNSAQPEAALEVWKILEDHNQDGIGVLLEGGGLMEQMGFVDETIAMIERYMAAEGDHADALLFLFDTYLDRGENNQALAALQRLDALLPPAASERRSLADAYERLEHPGEAVRIYEEIREAIGELGYDERSRLAWLYSVAGRKADALAAWREIWVEVESPARRSFAESQMLLLAAELSMLGDVVVELEQELYLGEADRNEIDLLVRIYTEVGDKISATEVIEEYAQQSGASELARLEQLGRVYMLLEDFTGYDRILRQLYEIDEPARIDHIRNIILNLLSHDLATDSNERIDDIRHWLGELRRLDEEAVSGEFEASIYSLGSFPEQAVKSYRRALAERPEVSDNLLLMADLLKNLDRRDEAVAMLQYVAENAKDDNEFVVAIDGLINMVGARNFGESLTRDIRAIFEWTKRAILERIAGVSDKFYLFTLLSEIAQETEDDEGAFVAVENSLPLAGVRRSAILRELVVMSTPDAGFAGFNTGQGDLRRQLKHGRRLVLLGEQLPPEVFIDLGKALLAKGDLQAASRAFEMINDITGLIDVNRTKGEIFLEEGFANEALEAFNRALSVNQDDLALLLNTALLFEREGRDEVAWRRYFRAIKGLLMRQPFELRSERRDSSSVSRFAAFTGEQVDTSVTPEYRQYYEALAQGLLITWPEEPAESADGVQELEAAFESELQAVLAAGGDDLQPLAKYSRLDHLAMLLRRITQRNGDTSLAASIDNRLLAHFAFDEDFTRQALASARAIWGGKGVSKHFEELAAVEEGVPSADNPTMPLENQRAIADASDDFRTALALARILAKETALFELFRTEVLDGNYYRGLGYARGLLGEQSYQRLVRSVAATLKEDPKALLELIDEQAEILIDAEERFEIEFANVGEVLNLLTDKQPNQNGAGGLVVFSAGDGRWDYFAGKASLEDKIRLLEALIEGATTSQFGVSVDLMLVAHGIEDMLKEPLDEDSQELLYEVVVNWFSEQDLKEPFVLQQLATTFLPFEAHEQNYPLVYRMAELLKQRTPTAVDLEPKLRAYFAGDGGPLLRELVDLNLIYRAGDHLDEAREASLEALRSGQRLDPQFALAIYTAEYRSFGTSPSAEVMQGKADLLSRMIELYPDETQYLLEWADLQLSLGNRRAAGQALEDCYQAMPEDEYLRAALYFYLISEQQYSRARLVNQDGGKDLTNPALVQELLQAIQNRGGFFAFLATGEHLFRHVAQDQLQAMGFAASYQWRPVERQLDLLHKSLNTKDESEARQAFRSVWRAMATPVQEESRGFYGEPLAAVRAFSRLAYSPWAGWGMARFSESRFSELLQRKGDVEPPLFELLADFSIAPDEFGAYAAALPDDIRGTFGAIYEYLIAALVSNGVAEQRLDALSGQLLEAELSDHELRVWMMLIDELNANVAMPLAEAFKLRIAQVANPSDFDNLLFARTFVHLGETETAREYYLLLAARLMPQQEYQTEQESYQRYIAPPATMTLIEFVSEISERLPASMAVGIAERVFSMAHRTEHAEYLNSVYHHFLVTALAELVPVSAVLDEAERISAGASTLEQAESAGETSSWAAPKGIEIARVHAINDDYEAALGIIHGIFAVSSDPSADTARNLEDYERTTLVSQAAQAYGLALFERRFYEESLSVAEEMVFRRNRLFPLATDEENFWQGAEDWTRRAASTMLEWLEGDEVSKKDTTEAVLVAIYQLHRAGRVDSARGLFDRLAKLVVASADEELVARLPDLILASEYFEAPLPSTLIAQALSRDLLDAAQAAAALRRYAELEGVDATLALIHRTMPGLADHGGLAVLLEVKALASQSEEGEEWTSLSARIKELGDAREELGISGA